MADMEAEERIEGKRPFYRRRALQPPSAGQGAVPDEILLKELRQLAEAQAREISRLSRLAELGARLTDIAHQWRQPLNALSIQLQLLAATMDAAGDFSPIDASLELIEQMSITMDDFLDFGRSDLAPAYFGVASAVGVACAIMDGPLRLRGIRCTVSCEKDLVAFGHCRQLSQVLVALLANSKEAHMARATSDAALSISAARKGQWVEVSVADNGGGIDSKILPLLFSEPCTSKGNAGHGVGLMLAGRLIREMGGTISASNGETGAIFTINLPAMEN